VDYQRLYEYRFRDVDQDARAAVWVEIARHVHGVLGRPGRVLDSAAGRGEFVNSVPAAERWAVDQVAYEEGTFTPGTKMIVADISVREVVTVTLDTFVPWGAPVQAVPPPAPFRETARRKVQHLTVTEYEAPRPVVVTPRSLSGTGVNAALPFLEPAR